MMEKVHLVLMVCGGLSGLIALAFFCCLVFSERIAGPYLFQLAAYERRVGTRFWWWAVASAALFALAWITS